MKKARFELASVSAFDTKYCLIITTQKIATQFIGQYIVKEHLAETGELYDYSSSPQFSLNINNDGVWDLGNVGNVENSSYKTERHLKSFENFLNGKITKDVIILIRNPWKRFKSALHQDYIKPFIHDSNPSSFFLLGSVILKNNNSELYKWWIDNRNTVNDIRTKSLQEESQPELLKSVKIICEELIQTWYHTDYEVQESHNHAYHPIVLNILLNNNNKQKIKIFDIDEVDLNDVFGKYVPGGLKIGKPNSTDYIKKIISDILDSDFEILNFVKSHMKMEELSYNTLSLYSKLYNN